MTVLLATLAALSGGLLAGMGIDRSVVALPAWRDVGPTAWAAFSRRADLGRGLVLYPLLGIGAPLLSVATAVSLFIGPGVPGAALPVYVAAILSVGHVLATSRAAPNMMKVRSSDDPEILQEAFEGFEQWQRARAVLQVATFGTNMWVLVALL